MGLNGHQSSLAAAPSALPRLPFSLSYPLARSVLLTHALTLSPHQRSKTSWLLILYDTPSRCNG